MNSQQKFEENGDVLPDWVRGSNHTLAGNSSNKGILHGYDAKPAQYQIGIDTFARMEANCSKEEILAFCKGNIDKYTWRTKGCDLEDFKKIIDYANFAIKQLEKNG